MSENNKKYGEAWRAELMKWRKSEIIDFLKDTLVCNRIHQWHYPSKGELPENDRLVVIYYKGGVADFGSYTKGLNGWHNKFGDSISEPYMWISLKPPKEV